MCSVAEAVVRARFARTTGTLDGAVCAGESCVAAARPGAVDTIVAGTTVGANESTGVARAGRSARGTVRRSVTLTAVGGSPETEVRVVVALAATSLGCALEANTVARAVDTRGSEFTANRAIGRTPAGGAGAGTITSNA